MLEVLRNLSMWVLTTRGFLSIVADKDDPQGPQLLVRARRRGDIEAAFGPDVEVQEGGGSDYRFRAWVDRHEVGQALADQVDEIDYGNFKNAIDDRAYHDAALECWFNLKAWQDDLVRRERLNAPVAPIRRR